MNTIVNVTEMKLKCLKTSDKNAIKNAKKKKLNKQYYLKNKEKINELNKQWSLKNKEKRKEIDKRYYLKNKEWRNEVSKQWNLKNKEYIREKNKKRRKTDSTYRLKINLKRRTILALKGQNKSANTMTLLGVTSIELLWKHLELTFKPGMTRENHGKWHIDHIIPCASFDLSKPEEQAKCFHYSNLQALWAHENLFKGAKIL